MKKKTNIDVTLQSFFAAAFICINQIADVTQSVFKIQSIVTLILPIIVLLFILTKKKFEINQAVFIFYGIYLILIIASILKYEIGYAWANDFIYFMVYGISSCVIVINITNINKFFRYIFMFSFAYIVFIFIYYAPRIYSGEISRDATLTISYLVLIGLFTSILMISERQLDRFISPWIIIYILLTLLYFFLINNNRGSIVAVGTFLLMFFNLKKTRVRRITTVIIIVSGIFFLARVLFVPDVAEKINDFLRLKLNMNWNWISRALSQISNGDFLSGREFLYSSAVGLIKDKPLTGSGIGFYQQASNGNYPHNLFLQIAVEFGLPIMTVFLFFTVEAVRTIFDDRVPLNSRKILLLFFSLSIPRLMFSSSYWELIPFWCFCAYFLKIYFQNGKRKRARTSSMLAPLKSENFNF